GSIPFVASVAYQPPSDIRPRRSGPRRNRRRRGRVRTRACNRPARRARRRRIVQVNDEPVKVYQVGESWYEVPGSHHKVSESASDREPASLLAVIVVDSSDKPLTTPDKK